MRVSKIAAAQRQLDAAIRMFLQSEDDLAVHTLGAASYRILRDLKEKCGRTELSDMLSNAGFNIAQKIVSGALTALPSFISPESEYGQIILDLVDGIRSGELRNLSQVRISVRDENGHWREFNSAANFLKHADLDDTETYDFSSVQNDRLLQDACRCYAELTGTVTAEIVAFQLWHEPDRGFLLELFGDTARELSAVTPDQRRARVIALLAELKQGEEKVPCVQLVRTPSH